MTSQQDLIRQFLQLKRIAFVGVSRKPSDFSRKLWHDFRTRGIDAIPVHSVQREVDGVRCYASVRDIDPPVEGVLILVSKNQIQAVIDDCAASGVKTVWVYGIRGMKDVHPDILMLCEERGIKLIAGFCPYMFLPQTHLFHRIHTFGWKLIGYYPQ